MSTPSSKPRTVDDDIAGFPPEVQQILTEVRQRAQAVVPGAGEKISYADARGHRRRPVRDDYSGWSRS